MKIYASKGVLYVLLLLVPIFGRAASPAWQIDPSQSTLSFTATQNGAPVTGKFKTFTGEIAVDPANYQTSNVHIVIDINSISTDYSDVRDILFTPDWFNVKMFPKAEFKSTSFNKIGNNTYQANGNLTIRDKTVPVTLTFTTEQPSPDTGVVMGSTVLKRSAFGVGQGEWADTDQVKDDVKVDFKVVAKKKP
ncbi:YceI family protein [Legionella micdadei]|uniref:Polyisoprenoid-binding protein YceI n=1 Tax=Legionella micdadei TaxID=451 RepID=A0A098GFD1_LEGMI|nr:YceI family protein [Legionella micdadei]ARG97360.1 polyisoprenoid-binding protein [Legionella micdadei]KTD28245.1 putative YceI-like family protein [Legionella micdadei]NSL16874.1 YceI family protein [Legionella micdadei]CEG61168.1 YceI-like family protein [Legionella micdadei]SCY32041.1 Polyisoprenoid-binding protein YceI [Legionella micdadei]